MRTSFTPDQLADPAIRTSEAVIRTCVHCGFCNATCPTHVLLGDELDSPRGRIYLIKDMLEASRTPTAEVVKHVDRCLSCLACETTCPSGVSYRRLVDHARVHIARRYRRPPAERAIRALIARVLPYRRRFRLALAFARGLRPAAPWLARIGPFRPLAAMLALIPAATAGRGVETRASGAETLKSAVTPASASPGWRGRVVLLQGCVEPALRPEIQAAAARLLARAGFEIVAARGEGCCGALVHHMGREHEALAAARRNVDVWTAEIAARGMEAIVVTASGCGSVIKDYGFLLRDDPAYAAKAARVSALARDVCELLEPGDLAPSGDLAPTRGFGGVNVAYQAACSLQHGQGVVEAPLRLLAAAGFIVRQPAEPHLCCGSAGTYNILQPELAERLGERKAANLEALQPDVVATGNVGCAVHLASRLAAPVVHTVELLDWATGGPAPPALQARSARGGTQGRDPRV